MNKTKNNQKPVCHSCPRSVIPARPTAQHRSTKRPTAARPTGAKAGIQLDPRLRGGDKGVLLIEVLFAITLLAFGITGCLRAMAQSLEITKRSREYAMAELAMDDLLFRMISGAEESLIKDGGDGKFESPAVDLDDLHYYVESKQINPYVPPTEEELRALERAGEPIPGNKTAQVEEKYRMINARITWRGGKEELDLFTVMRVPDVNVLKK